MWNKTTLSGDGWLARKLEDPIPLPSGGELRTLLDAGNYIQSLSKTKQQQESWQIATEALLLVVNQNGPTMFARIGIMLAPYPRGRTGLQSRRQETPLGQRKLKRDE
jgi:hypothetical protein